MEGGGKEGKERGQKEKCMMYMYQFPTMDVIIM